MTECSDCKSLLTLEEIKYYEIRCEMCEHLWADKMEFWRKGGDALFNMPFG